MIYFKKVYFNYDERANIEAAFRKVSLKRGRTLDWVSTQSNIGSDKYFLGHEGKNQLSFTRMKSSVEALMPKIIFSVPANPVDTYYKFRLALIPFIVYCAMSFFLLFGLISLIFGKIDFENFISFALFPIIFISLFFLELKITLLKIKKAIVKYQVLE